MSTLETVLGFVGTSGLIGSAASYLKTRSDTSALKQLVDAKLSQVAALEQKVLGLITQANDLLSRANGVVERLPAMEQRVQDAIREARRTGQRTGDVGHATTTLRELEALRREIETIRTQVCTTDGACRALEQLEKRLERFEAEYRSDYKELLTRVTSLAGEFKEARRERDRERESDA